MNSTSTPKPMTERDILRAEVSRAFAITAAVAEAVRTATIMGRVSLEGYQKMLGVLKGADLIREDASHLLHWTGPTFEVRQ